MLNNKVRLGDLIEVLTDYHANGAYKKLKENVELLDDEDYALMVRTTNFENNDFHDSVKYISEHAYNFLEKSKVYPNDLIMNKIANAGSIYLMPDLQRPVSLAMNLFLIRINEKLANPIYVYLYLKINEQYVKQFANGSVTKTITKEAVRNLEIFLPSREEQDIVVEQYLSLDNKINLNLKINQNLESITQAIFKSWFIDFDVVRAKIQAKQESKDSELAAMCVISGKSEEELQQMPEEDFAELQATAALFPDELVESELGEVPAGWEKIPFDQIAKAKKGKNITKKNTSSGNIPVVAGGLKPAYFHNEYNVEGPVVTISASGANAGYVNLYQQNIWASDCSFISKDETTSIYTIYTFLKIKQNEITKMQQGAAQPHVYPKDLKRLIFPKIPGCLILKFEEFSQKIFSKIHVNDLENNALNSIKEIILPKFFSGEVVIHKRAELE
ncbi:restriction endonuclease subunit S [Acinetobacter sp. ASP199]|uniref:restriction endonuclease subunit S n=1 Tax=unclassified Acinetobacter TaxID=196816 RepID=UPI001F609B73|nr:restriction endonuclease subunit S [Acinetobacter sp. ASP199]UNT58826.1 restriction endonuclease subunit S [Acinetobacter sp. ASP199]